ncbi:UDP-N-acetylmuramate--L-alanine ligase [Clostridiaceae bacterium M8S5]|nr:UDP-N-acetylmuramate--L-alanine ligase [Clostridiaceae bacterium M8S5]
MEILKKTKVHFMGICGSGAAPVAIIAKNMGFDVSGCDFKVSGYYSDMLIENNIEVLEDHDANHIDDVEILAVSPAVLEVSPNHPEIIKAKEKEILMTWQEFLATYIQDGRFVISIAGTHGKSTTTILMGLVLENAGLDPIVEAGTTFKKWGGGYRIGRSDYFVCEADEYNNNFLNYTSSIAIINNVEMDHPEFFKDLNEIKDSFKKFIKKLRGPKILIVNEESIALKEILFELEDWIKDRGVKVIGYYINNKVEFPFANEYKVVLGLANPESTTYKIINKDKEYEIELGLIGKHNIENSLGVFIASLELGVNIDVIKESFKDFKGIGRRLDLIDSINDIKVYDDFAHHPTAVALTIDTMKNSYPGKKVFAIFEPHQISRIKLFFDEFIAALSKADRVIISKPFLGREVNKSFDPINLEQMADQINTERAEYIQDYDEICNKIVKEVKNGDIIIVFGAGESYKISRKIVNKLKKRI